MKYYQLLHFFTKDERIIPLLNLLFLSFMNDGSLDLLLLFQVLPFHSFHSPHTDTLQPAFTTFSICFPFFRLRYSTEQFPLPVNGHSSFHIFPINS